MIETRDTIARRCRIQALKTLQRLEIFPVCRRACKIGGAGRWRRCRRRLEGRRFHRGGARSGSGGARRLRADWASRHRRIQRRQKGVVAHGTRSVTRRCQRGWGRATESPSRRRRYRGQCPRRRARVRQRQQAGPTPAQSRSQQGEILRRHPVVQIGGERVRDRASVQRSQAGRIPFGSAPGVGRGRICPAARWLGALGVGTCTRSCRSRVLAIPRQDVGGVRLLQRVDQPVWITCVSRGAWPHRTHHRRHGLGAAVPLGCGHPRQAAPGHAPGFPPGLELPDPVARSLQCIRGRVTRRRRSRRRRRSILGRERPRRGQQHDHGGGLAQAC